MRTSQHPDHKSVSDKKLNIDRSRRPRPLRPSVKSLKRSEGADALKEKKTLSDERQSHLKRQSHEIVNKTADRGPSANIRTARETSREKRSHDKKRVSGPYSEHVRRQSAGSDSMRSRQNSDLQNIGKQSESENTGQLMDTLLRSLSVVELSAKGESFTRLVTEKLTNLIEEQSSRASGLKEGRWRRSRSPVRRHTARRRSVSPSQSSFKQGSTRAKSPAMRRVFMSRKSLSPQRPPPARMLSPRPPAPPRNHSPGRHFQVSSHPLQDSNPSRHNQNRGPSPRHHRIMSPIRRSEESGANNLREGMWLSQPPQTPQTYQGPDPRSNIQIVSGRNREEDLRKSQGTSKNLVSIQSEWAAVPPGSQTNAGRPSDGQDLLDQFIGQMKRNSQSHPTSSRANFEDAPKLDSVRSNSGGSVNFIDSGIGLGVRNTSDLGHGGLPSGSYNTARGENTESVPGTYNTVRRENTESNQAGQRFDTPYRPQAGTNMNWFGRQESKPAFERPQETFERSQFSADYHQQNHNMNVPPPIPPPVAPPILNQSLSSQDRISQLEALAKQLAMDIQKQQPAHHGQTYWPFSMQQQQNTMNMPRPQSTMMGAASQPSMMGPPSQLSMMGPPSQHSTMGPPSQSSMMGSPSQSSMMGQPSQPPMLRGPAPVHMQGYLPQTTPTMGSQPSATFPGANAWQRGRNF
ncbi:unnamed protein product [Lymnaea stagnalis]|uniref:Uncharacterized protein n=1 Tax=Lymnaea stagnalis TaxID=6523 RepID=A0AAV2HTH2_LYMST